MAKKNANTAPTPGTRRVTTVEETVEEGAPGGEIALPLTEPTEEGGDDFLGVLADLAGGAEARCEIRRTSPSEFAGYCCTYALSEMSLDRLQSEWGGGKFNVRVRNARGEFKGSTNVQVAGKPRNRDDQPAVVSSPVAPAPSVDLSGVVAAIQSSTQGQVAMLTELVKGLLVRPEPKVERGPDVLEVVTALAPILKPDKSAAGDPADAIKLLMQGIELGKELAGGGGSGDTFTDLALKGMDMVKTVAAAAPPVTRVPVRQAAPPAPRLAAPAPGTVEAQASEVQPAKQELPPMLKLLGWIKQQAALLVHQAKRKRSPSLYAELFLDNLPEGVPLETIYEQLSGDKAIEKLADVTGNKEILDHRAWFEEFRAEVLKAFAPEAGSDGGNGGGEFEPEGGEGDGIGGGES